MVLGVPRASLHAAAPSTVICVRLTTPTAAPALDEGFGLHYVFQRLASVSGGGERGSILGSAVPGEREDRGHTKRKWREEAQLLAPMY